MIIAEIENGQIEVVDKISFGYFTVDYKHEVEVIKGYIEERKNNTCKQL